MNSGGGLPPPSAAAASPSSSSLAAAVAAVAVAASSGVGSVPGGPAAAAAAAGVKLKYCRYYAKDKTCFYGEECQFLHEDPAASGAAPGLGLHSNSVPLALAAAPGAGFPPGALPGGGAGPPAGPKKPELGVPGVSATATAGGGGLDGPRLASECGAAGRAGGGRPGAAPQLIPGRPRQGLGPERAGLLPSPSYFPLSAALGRAPELGEAGSPGAWAGGGVCARGTGGAPLGVGAAGGGRRRGMGLRV